MFPKMKPSSELQLLVLGELNATMGKEMQERLPKHVRRFLPEKESSWNGELMAEMIELGLRVNNSFFKKKETKKMSWRHPRTGKFSLKDYHLSP